jgi:hypothetical protein
VATTPEQIEAEEARRSLSRNQVLAGVGILLVVVLLLWLFVFSGGDDPATDPLAPPQGAPPTTAPAVPPDTDGDGDGNGKGDGDKGRVETFTVFAPKDPFKPLITDTGTDGAVTDPGTDTGDGDGDGDGDGTDGDGDGTDGDGTDGDGTDGDGTDGDGTDGDGPDGDDGGESIGGHRVKLIDVFTDGGRERAEVQVDDTVYTVDVGEEFADSFKLLSTSGRCASLLFGDDQFSLCEGQEILK